MLVRIAEIEALPELKLRAKFDDGKVVVYDVAEDVRQVPSYGLLETVPGLFNCVQLDESRTCVFWNNEIDLPSDALYEYGVELPEG